MVLAFLVLAALIVVVYAIADSHKMKSVLAPKQKHLKVLPKAIGMVMVTAQFTELVKIIDHISIVNVAAALLLLTIMLATRSGTEGEIV